MEPANKIAPRDTVKSPALHFKPRLGKHSGRGHWGEVIGETGVFPRSKVIGETGLFPRSKVIGETGLFTRSKVIGETGLFTRSIHSGSKTRIS